ncbi:SufE family protein [Pelagibacteraceae bacterium]|nr:SufE family protein [Pelagibacteraceae bacterium]
MIVDKIKAKGVEISVLEGTDRLQYLIDIANEVSELDNQYKVHDNKIAGCASNLWVVGAKETDNTMLYKFDADAFITKGTAKLVIDLLNNEPVTEISKLNKDDFKNLGILELLTAQRQSGLSNLIDTLISIAKKNLV